MKPAPFSYKKVSEIGQAFDLLDKYGADARLIAGGQSLIPTLNLRLSAPQLLIDISALNTLRGIEVVGNEVRIGALTRHVEIERSPTIAARLPLLAQAMPHVAHAAIRNRGTIGGSLSLADPAAELPACVLALNASMVLASSRGERRVKAMDFFKGLYATALDAYEILVRIDIPLPASGERHHFNEFARRHGDYALVGIAAVCGIQGSAPRELRLVFFGCGDRPLRASHSEAAILQGGFRSVVLEQNIARAIVKDLDPQSDLHASSSTRLHLASILARRSITSFLQD